MMRTMAVWLSAVLMVNGLWSASGVSQGLADEPAAPSSSSEVTEGAAGKEMGGSEAAAPVAATKVEGQTGSPPQESDVRERGLSSQTPGTSSRQTSKSHFGDMIKSGSGLDKSSRGVEPEPPASAPMGNEEKTTTPK